MPIHRLNERPTRHGILGVEMEAAALFTLASRAQAAGGDVRAACILTVSDTMSEEEEIGETHLPLDALEKSTDVMIKVTLEADLSISMPDSLAIPVGLNPTAIGVDAAWWLDAARRAEEAGFETVWIWDHFISRGRLEDPLLACWPMLAAAAVIHEQTGVVLDAFAWTPAMVWTPLGMLVLGALAAVAGTHLVSAAYGVAAIGNVFTHPERVVLD